MSLAPLPTVVPERPTRATRAISVECVDSATVVYLSGELDLSTLDEEHRTMACAIGLDLPLVVDLSGVEFMDATTIRLLVRSAAFVQARARSFTIRRPSPFAARLLTICGLDDLVADHAPHLVVVDLEDP